MNKHKELLIDMLKDHNGIILFSANDIVAQFMVFDKRVFRRFLNFPDRYEFSLMGLTKIERGVKQNAV